MVYVILPALRRTIDQAATAADVKLDAANMMPYDNGNTMQPFDAARSPSHRRAKTGIAAFFILLLGVGLGIAGTMLSSLSPLTPDSLREVRRGKYTLVNPLLECDQGQEYLAQHLRPFRYDMVQLVDDMVDDGRASKISVYFRDLNNGPWFGIHEQDDFIPASLLKVPILMTVYRLSRDNPELLRSVIPYRDAGPSAFTQHIQSPEQTPGASFTVEELAMMMVKYSDNNAATLLKNAVGDDELEKTFQDLGLVAPGGQDYFITAKTYASFFRILYNASYLGINESEQVLRLLTETDFKKGLPAGVDPGVSVAHKFGERGQKDSPDKQLHDCGIIYHPQRPYLLCIMTRGSDFDALVKIIRDISAFTYRRIEQQFGGG
ncbi:MAG: beta-lactamase [Parcubacteria group bacterium Gr01-1014_31]|nr:MAG: beta-lactamase [Parcubacteria group bacterium Gr01-1014_31]